MAESKSSRPPGEDPRDAWLVRLLPQLHSYVRQRMSADLQEIEGVSDVVQSACREVLACQDRRRRAAQGESQFRAWLFQAAWHKIIDRFRRHRARKRRPADDLDRPRVTGEDALRRLADHGPSPASRLVRKEHASLLGQAITRLTAQQQQAIRWFYEEGLAYAEIGRRTGRSEAAAKMFVRRAVARLGMELGEGKRRA